MCYLWGEQKNHPTQKGPLTYTHSPRKGYPGRDLATKRLYCQNGSCTYGIYPTNPDVTRCHPKRWFSREITFFSGKSRLVKYFGQMAYYTHLNYHQMFKPFMDGSAIILSVPSMDPSIGLPSTSYVASHVLPGNNIWLQWINFIGLLVVLTGGVPRERYGDDKGGERSSVFLCVAICMGFQLCCTCRDGIRWDVGNDSILKRPWVFRKCLYCTFGHLNWDESRRIIGPVTRRILWLTFVVCFTCSQFILEKGCALMYINMEPICKNHPIKKANHLPNLHLGSSKC